ncbi:MAG: hypothetical protein FJW39_12720 [Acidobacteria bacterium]|nr:hypothetical protein [Acidobacteriota bacterium]
MAAPYRLLIPKRRGVFRSSHVWAGDGHILHVDNTRFHENYQRFRFDEIQAVTYTQKGSLALLQWAGLVTLVLIYAAVLWAAGTGGVAIFFGIFFVPLIAALIVDIANGPRCVCMLQTAVGAHHLTAVSRVKRAREFLDAVEPLIREAQGESPVPAAPAPASPETAPKPPEPPSLPRPGHQFPLVEASFGVTMLLQAGLIGLFFAGRYDALAVASPTLVSISSLLLAGVSLIFGFTRGFRIGHVFVVLGTALACWDWFRAAETGFSISSQIGGLSIFQQRGALAKQVITAGFMNYSRIALWTFVSLGLATIAEAIWHILKMRRKTSA